MLASQGVTELSLVSQDSVMWGRDTGEGSFIDLLTRLERVEGVRRIRLMYLHPQGVTEELVDKILSSETIVSYFDLSLQHVAPAVLKGMGRWGSRARFDDLIGRIRAADPLAGVRSTFILGFPGETDADATEVERFVGDTDLDWVGTFVFSREEGTRSHDMDEQVDAVEARARAERVAAIADETMRRRAASLVGKRFEVLVERLDLEDQEWVGRSQREAPEVDGDIRFPATTDLKVGDYVPVTIEAADGADLIASTT